MLPALLFAVLMLFIGFWLRVLLKPLQWMFVPASIVAGFCGFAWIQAASWQEHALVTTLSSWPGMLIAVVFACMFLDHRGKSLAGSLRLAGREGIVVWIVVLGQTAVGLLCTWLLIQPFWDVPNSFGMLIETGFAGGHGTAGAMADVFDSEIVQFAQGRDLGFFMATVGLVFSVLSGVFYVNLAIRLGWVQRISEVQVVQGLENRAQPVPIAKSSVRAEVIDPLVLQVVFVGLAFGIGWCLQQGLKTGIAHFESPAQAELSESLEPTEARSMEAERPATDELLGSRMSLMGTVGDFPLFIYTLFGGLAVRLLLSATGYADLIDSQSIHRISGVAMEFLIVSAISTLNVTAIVATAAPLLILVVAVFVWTGFCLLFVARQLLPQDYWFELGILNYGMSTGTTATGFTLLKIVDRDLDSGAAEDYALAAPLSSPFIGGGMVTIGLPLLVLERVPIAASALVTTLLVLGLYVLGRQFRDR